MPSLSVCVRGSVIWPQPPAFDVSLSRLFLFLWNRDESLIFSKPLPPIMLVMGMSLRFLKMCNDLQSCEQLIFVTFSSGTILKNIIGPCRWSAADSFNRHLSWCVSRYGFIASVIVLSRVKPNSWN